MTVVTPAPQPLGKTPTLLAFEQAHKARKGVLQAAQERLDVLADA